MKFKLMASVVSVLALGSALVAGGFSASAANVTLQNHRVFQPQTTTPVKHLVVLFQENVSFDHYFGTYPNAVNTKGEPQFNPAPNTPSVNGLNANLLNNNPNAANPKRLDRSQALTCDQDHSYADEQKAFDHGLMDKFVESVSGSSCTDKSIVMDYYDGNTVTGFWNYAQNFAMSDNSYGTTFGPSTPGALNLVAGQTHGATATGTTKTIASGSLIGDADPTYDDCSNGSTVAMSGKNVGDLLNAKNISWGWFEGGFRATATTNGKAVCGASHQNIGGGAAVTDYIPHHEPFQYYQSTANPHHLAPTSAAMIGKTDRANHQYDMQDFWTSVNQNNMPAVSFLKAPAYQDGHAGYSDPLDEQHYVVNTINRLEKTPEWNSTAVVIAYDDSDGWYDHVMGPIVNQSNDPNDNGLCGTAKAGAYQARCGYGPRLPLMIISPFARKNFVDHSISDQSSILKFVEDNWNLGRIGDQSFDAMAGSLNNMFDFSNYSGANNKLFLNLDTGEVIGR